MHVSELPDRSQDYLKKIYDLQEWGRAGTGNYGGATLSTLAAELGQRRSTASEAVKRLVAEGLVVHAPYGDITLSEEGRRLALQMVRRHRLIETYLQRELGYARDEVHNEAEVLEHAVSDLFIPRIDAAMGHPDRDPHGDPIPDPEGRVEESATVPLSGAQVGDRLYVDRVSDRDGALLRYLEDHGVLPGAVIEVGERPYPDMATVRVLTAGGAAEVQLSRASLDAVLCREAE
ncbi:metal-dependent transcriptional regulator [Corynebacterium neomassiliense]|uniref:metal-dependent transcriptional regulator n=1 Tax=Corynebacterium neomassiliense TaxID=2079482 RepID=UPI00102F3998|nr:metal-dependent transcriptional regulator [Corynebacterium neomassiliense]